MSPEQLNSARDVDARADIWSLGIILYELLTGNTPFRADTVPQLCVAIMNHRTPPLRAIRPDIPTALEAVIERCLEKDRSRRFSSAEELAIALADFASVRVRASLERIGGKRAVSAVPSDGRNTVTVAPDLRGANSSSRDGSTVSQWGGTSSGLQGSSRRKAAIVAIGVTGLAVAAVVGFSVVRGSGVQPSPTTFDHVAGSSGAQSQETSGLSALVPPASENAALPSTDINEPALAAPSSLRGELSAVSPRSNASEKVSKGAKARTGGASKVAPAASSARTPVPQKGPSDRWEDER
jgi:serine/threonine-protein kinase